MTQGLAKRALRNISARVFSDSPTSALIRSGMLMEIKLELEAEATAFAILYYYYSHHILFIIEIELF